MNQKIMNKIFTCWRNSRSRSIVSKRAAKILSKQQVFFILYVTPFNLQVLRVSPFSKIGNWKPGVFQVKAAVKYPGLLKYRGFFFFLFDLGSGRGLF